MLVIHTDYQHPQAGVGSHRTCFEVPDSNLIRGLARNLAEAVGTEIGRIMGFKHNRVLVERVILSISGSEESLSDV